MFRSGWEWASVEGPTAIVGLDDPSGGTDPEELRVLLRDVFSAAGGTHDDWDEYDRVMRDERRAVVLVTPDARHRQLMASDPAPRIPPLTDELDDQARELVELVAGGPAAQNIFTTLVRHPGLFRKWIPFAGKLLAGKLPARDRELLILRTGYRCGSVYEWGQHVVIGRAAGITEEELPRIQEGPEADGWSARDALLLRAADELHDDSCISDATWDALTRDLRRAAADRDPDARRPLPPRRVHAAASLGVQREPGVPGFDGVTERPRRSRREREG